MIDFIDSIIHEKCSKINEDIYVIKRLKKVNLDLQVKLKKLNSECQN